MRVAVIQMKPEFKAVKQNLTVARSLVMRAVAGKADLIVLPELTLTGYSFMSREDAKPYGLVHTVGVSAFEDIVQRHQVAVAWGTLELEGTSLYNSQILLTPEQHVVCRKHNLWGNDFLWATEGKESPPILEYRGKRLGTLICRDVRDKGPRGSTLTDFYEEGDADVVCFSANFGNGGFPSVSWIDFARSNKVWLACANRYGSEANNDFGQGGICVVEPCGKVHCEGLEWSAPCIVYADVT